MMAAGRVAWHALARLPPALWAVSIAGWLLLSILHSGRSMPALCPSPGAEDRTARGLEFVFAYNPPVILLLGWAVMLTAMIPTLLAEPLQHIWQRSLTRRRARAIALFAVGYVIPWLAAGSVLSAASLVLVSLSDMAALPPLAIACIVALAWQVTPLKQISLNRCHARPSLAALGLRAELDSFCFGARHGIWCVGGCWALMLLPLTAQDAWHWVAMFAVTVVSLVERAREPAPVRWGAAWPGAAAVLRDVVTNVAVRTA